MKIFIIIFLSLFTSKVAITKELASKFCNIEYKPETSTSVFNCYNSQDQSSQRLEVSVFEESFFKKSLEASGVHFFNQEEFNPQDAELFLKMIRGAGNQNISCMATQKVGYKSDEVMKAAPSHQVVKQIENLIDALKAAAICEVTTFDPNFGIKNNDDLLNHFLCIANIESTYGEVNIGQGGRGAFGIHPMHDLKGGICEEFHFLAKNETGELKDNSFYEKQKSKVANAKCAIKLYLVKGLNDWGKKANTNWGSNRVCTKEYIKRFNYTKILKEKACCSKTCKEKALKNS